MQRSLYDTKGAEPQEVEAGAVIPHVELDPATVDKFAEVSERLSNLEAEIERASLPFDEDIRELERKKAGALEHLLRKKRDAQFVLSRLEREILGATEGQEHCFANGTNGATTVQVKRSFTRKVDAEGLWDALDREGKLEHFGFLFKKSVNVKDFDGAVKQPLFVSDAGKFIKSTVRNEKVEVI